MSRWKKKVLHTFRRRSPSPFVRFQIASILPVRISDDLSFSLDLPSDVAWYLNLKRRWVWSALRYFKHFWKFQCSCTGRRRRSSSFSTGKRALSSGNSFEKRPLVEIGKRLMVKSELCAFVAFGVWKSLLLCHYRVCDYRAHQDRWTCALVCLSVY